MIHFLENIIAKTIKAQDFHFIFKIDIFSSKYNNNNNNNNIIKYLNLIK